MICYDSELSAGALVFNYHCVVNCSLVKVGYGLRVVCQKRASVGFRHVSAHCGDPWNEFADKICKAHLDHGSHAFGKVSDYFVCDQFVCDWAMPGGDRKPAWAFDTRICLDKEVLMKIGFKVWSLGSTV